MAQMVHAIHGLHSNKVIHRDLKPANILLTPENYIRLCLFFYFVITSILYLKIYIIIYLMFNILL